MLQKILQWEAVSLLRYVWISIVGFTIMVWTARLKMQSHCLKHRAVRRMLQGQNLSLVSSSAGASDRNIDMSRRVKLRFHGSDRLASIDLQNSTIREKNKARKYPS
jgi:hypothetical protein